MKKLSVGSCFSGIGGQILDIMRCVHNWKLKFVNVFAAYEKRKKGPVFCCRGNYEECVKCRDGQFVPFNPQLRIVPADLSEEGHRAILRK